MARDTSYIHPIVAKLDESYDERAGYDFPNMKISWYKVPGSEVTRGPKLLPPPQKKTKRE